VKTELRVNFESVSELKILESSQQILLSISMLSCYLCQDYVFTLLTLQAAVSAYCELYMCAVNFLNYLSTA